MRKRKVVSLMLSSLLVVSMFVGCSSNENVIKDENVSAGKTDEVTITFMNSKGEIATQVEDAADKFMEENPNIKIEIVNVGVGQSPFEKVSTMYASGNAPTLIMMDAADILKFDEKFADLSGEKWVSDSMDNTLSLVTNDSNEIKAFPFTLEGMGIIYNKDILDEVSINPEDIKTIDSLSEACEKVKEAGYEAVTLSSLDWSLGAHFIPKAYVSRSENTDDIKEFFNSLFDGEIELKDDSYFNGLIDCFDILMKYNMDASDPLATTYEKNQQYMGSGEVAFWFQGNWTWPLIEEFSEGNTNYGFIPVPISNNADDYGNSQVLASVTKYIALDGVNNSEEQQDAGKKFLEWLVYEESGVDFVINESSLISPFKNVTIEPVDPLSKSIKDYVLAGNSIEFQYDMIPSDHTQEVGALMQKYLSGQSSREELATGIEDYFKSKK